MSNYSGFSGFKEGESLPPNTYVCVIKSERPAVGGQIVQGERGVAYKIKGDTDNLYVIGNGWYWRGPKSETTAFEVPAHRPNVKVTIGGADGTLIGEALLDVLKQSITLKTPYSYKPVGGTIGSSSYFMNQPFTYQTVKQYQPAVPKGPPPKMTKKGR